MKALILILGLTGFFNTVFATVSFAQTGGDCNLSINQGTLASWEIKKIKKFLSKKRYSVTIVTNDSSQLENSLKISFTVESSAYGHEGRAKCEYSLNELSYRTNTATLIGSDAASAVRSSCFQYLLEHMKKNIEACSN